MGLAGAAEGRGVERGRRAQWRELRGVGARRGETGGRSGGECSRGGVGREGRGPGRGFPGTKGATGARGLRRRRGEAKPYLKEGKGVLCH